MNNRIFLSLLIPIIVLQICCSKSPPEIHRVFWQINIVEDHDLKKNYEQLALFVNSSDEDGKDDLEYIYLIFDKEELFWKFDNETWNSMDIDNELWLGSNKITMPDYSSIPRGEARVILIDQYGDRAFEKIFIPAKKMNVNNMDFPVLEIKGNNFRVKSRYKTKKIWLYDGTGNLINEVNAKNKGIPMEEIFFTEEPEDNNRLFLYAYDSESGFGLISGPWLF